MALTVIDFGADAASDDTNQVIKLLRGDAGAGQPVSLTDLSDAGNFSLTVRNQAAPGRALSVLNASGATMLQVNNSGVVASPDGTITATQVVVVNGSQTMLNKTLTAPTITSYAPENLAPPGADILAKRSFARAWVSFQANAVSIFDQHNVTSVSGGASVASTGQWTIDWNTNFLNANYCVEVTVEDAAPMLPVVKAGTRGSGSCQINCYTLAGASTDPAALHVVAYGINAGS